MGRNICLLPKTLCHGYDNVREKPTPYELFNRASRIASPELQDKRDYNLFALIEYPN